MLLPLNLPLSLLKSAPTPSELQLQTVRLRVLKLKVLRDKWPYVPEYLHVLPASHPRLLRALSAPENCGGCVYLQSVHTRSAGSNIAVRSPVPLVKWNLNTDSRPENSIGIFMCKYGSENSKASGVLSRSGSKNSIFERRAFRGKILISFVRSLSFAPSLSWWGCLAFLPWASIGVISNKLQLGGAQFWRRWMEVQSDVSRV